MVSSTTNNVPPSSTDNIKKAVSGSASSMSSSSSGSSNSSSSVTSIASLFLDKETSRIIWLAGYLSALLFSFLYYTNVLIMARPFLNTNFLFKLSMLGMSLSFLVSVLRALPAASKTSRQHGGVEMQQFMALISNESTPYLVLCLLAALLAPIPVLYLPLNIYALFNVLTFFNTNQQLLHPAIRPQVLSICHSILPYQPHSLSLAAHLELMIYPWILLTGFLPGGSFLAIILYPQYLRWQYAVSGKARNVWKQWTVLVSVFKGNSACPQIIARGLTKVQAFLGTIAPAPLRSPAAAHARSN